MKRKMCSNSIGLSRCAEGELSSNVAGPLVSSRVLTGLQHGSDSHSDFRDNPILHDLPHKARHNDILKPHFCAALCNMILIWPSLSCSKVPMFKYGPLGSTCATSIVNYRIGSPSLPLQRFFLQSSASSAPC